MADPNWAHGPSSNAGSFGPQQGPPPGAAPVTSKMGMMPPGPGQYNSQPGVGPPQTLFPGMRPPGPSPMVSQPGAPQNLPPGTFGGAPSHTPNMAGGAPPPGTFGAPSRMYGPPQGHYPGVNSSHSATPPPLSTNLLTTPSTGMVRSSSSPSMPPGQFGQPVGQQMVNGLPARPPGPAGAQPGQVRPQGQPGPPAGIARPPLHTINGQGPGQYPRPPMSSQPQNQMGPNIVQTTSLRPGVPPTHIGATPPQVGAPPLRPSGGPLPTGAPPSQGLVPPPRPGAPPSQGLGPPPRPGVPPPQGQQGPSQPGGRPNELPLPYQGHGQYSHQVPGLANMATPTPNTSEPPSQKSSRAPSPVAGQQYDALEGQFTPSGGQTPGQQPSDGQSPPSYGQSYAPGSRAPPSAPTGGYQTTPTLPGQQNMPPMPGAQPTPPVPTSQPRPGMPASQPMPGMPTSQPMPGMPASQPMPGMPASQPMPGMPASQPMPGMPASQPMPGMTASQPLPGMPTSQPMPGMSPMATSQAMPGGSMPPPPSGSGITGRRQYPQMQPQPPVGGAAPPNQPSTAPAPGAMPGGVPQPGVPTYPANNAYPTPNNTATLNSSLSNMKLQHDVQRPLNLLQERNILPPEELEIPKPNLPPDYKKANCSPEIFRCTLNSIPNTQSLLTKSRLPLGIMIHPFKDLAQLPVIQSSVIVRCRSCRTYINPFVTFVDMRRWKCNLCYRANDLPEEFNYDPVSKTYGEPQRRPEIKSGTIEFIAPSEYMLRPPQPAVYLFVLDVSYNARETGYLHAFCQTLLDELDRLPGDSRTQIGFLAFDRSLYFFNLAEGLSQPQMLIVSDTDEVFIPAPDNLLVNLQESKELVTELLNILPEMFRDNLETGSALGPALESAYKLMSPTGGRVSVFQTLLPSVGNGALKSREDPNERSGKKVQHLGPATDFYKRLALDCSAQQIGVDLFLLNSQYADISSIGCVSKFSGGTLHYFPAYHAVTNPTEAERFEGVLRRYISRKIGFEAVMRIRCSRGLSIHTFHGNFFVRSTDLLSLPNVNPDAGFGMQMSIEDTIDANYVCFQAALLYTSSKGERRIRVHTLAIPITQQLSEVHAAADQMAIVSLLAKMAVDKSLSSSLGDARDALINSSIDMLGSYGSTLTTSQRQGMVPCPYTLRLQPLFTLALLKSLAFRVGLSTKVDDRVNSMEQWKNLPACYLLQMVYPHLYPVHNLDDKNNVLSKGDAVVPQPPLLQLSSANMDRHGAYLMDTGARMYLWVGAAISDQYCRDVLDRPNFSSIPDPLFELSELDNPTSDLLRTFIGHLNDQRPFPASLSVLREDSRGRMQFLEHMIEDRTESTFSYYEYLQHLQKELKS